MTTFARCLVLEQGWLFLVLSMAIWIIASMVGIVLVVYGLRHPPQVLTDIGYNKDAKYKGPVGPIVVLIGILLILAPFAGIPWASYHYFSDMYSVDLDTPTVEQSLRDIKAGFGTDTRSPILLADKVNDFKITGHYKGMCVSDLFSNICDRHPSQLSCKISWMGTTIEAGPGL